MRGFIVKFLDKSIKMLSIAVFLPLKILVGKFTALFRLHVVNRMSVVFYYDYQDNIYIPTDNKFVVSDI